MIGANPNNGTIFLVKLFGLIDPSALDVVLIEEGEVKHTVYNRAR
jgi:hypothetical protein